MEDIRTMIKNMSNMEGSKYTFKRIPSAPGFNTFRVDDKGTGDHIDTLTFDSLGNVSSVIGEVPSLDIISEYNQFKTRPEWWLGQQVYPEALEEVCRYYDVFIVASMLERFHDKGDEFGIKVGMRILDWLATTDFYSAVPF